MHKGQSEKIKKHLKDMRKEAKDVKLETKKNCGCGQDPCVTYGKKELTQAQKVDEACWKGYKAYGMKKKGNRMVPNCKPIGSIKKEDYYAGTGEKVAARTKKYMDKKGMKGAPGLDAMKARTADHKAKRGVSEAKVDQGRSDYGKASIRNYRRSGPGHGEPAMFDPENKRGKLIDKRREEHKARRGVKGAKVPAYKTEEVVNEEDKKGKGSGTKDACYHKVKASAKVWPSAYASGRLVQCRKKGAANYGKSKSEGFEGWTSDPILEKVAAWQRKEGKSKSGGLNEKGRKSYEKANPGSDLKAPQPEGGSRKKSFCARMGGMKKKLTSAKTANDPDSRINKALRKWKC
jgi:hypothetical protein